MISTQVTGEMLSVMSLNEAAVSEDVLSSVSTCLSEQSNTSCQLSHVVTCVSALLFLSEEFHLETTSDNM